MPGTDAPVPLLRADYVPPTNLSSHGPRGRESFPITFDNLGPLDTRVTSASVRWSTDDRTWHAASLSRKDGNTFRVSYVNPAATRAHPAVSLRIKATDRAGRTLSEQVQNAYLLPTGSARTATTGTQAHRHALRPEQALPDVGHPPVPLLREAERRHEVGGSGQPRPGRLGSPGSASGLRPVRSVGDHDGRGDRGFRLPVGRGGPEHATVSSSDCRPARVRAAASPSSTRRASRVRFPQQDFGWGVEASLDLQMISDGVPDLSHRPGRGQPAHRRGAGPRRDRGGERRGHGDQPLVRSDRADRDRHPGRALRPSRSDRGRLDR